MSKPYVVTSDQWKEAAIALDGLVTELEVKITKLETELQDTKRALGMRCDASCNPRCCT